MEKPKSTRSIKGIVVTVVLALSLLLNTVLLGLFASYKYTGYWDYAIMYKVLPRLCEHLEEENPYRSDFPPCEVTLPVRLGA